MQEPSKNTLLKIESLYAKGLLGSDPELMVSKIYSLKKQTRWVNFFIIGLSLILMAIPTLQIYSILIKACFLWISLITIWLSKNLYTIQPETQNDPRPSFFLGVFSTSILLGWDAITRAPSYQSSSSPRIIAFTIAILLFFLISKSDTTLKGKKALRFLFFLTICFPYSYGLITLSNYLFDTSQPSVSPCKVVTVKTNSFGQKNALIKQENMPNPLIVNLINREIEYKENNDYLLNKHAGFLGLAWYTLTTDEPK